MTSDDYKEMLNRFNKGMENDNKRLVETKSMFGE
jgi:hypothetical protein